MTSLTLNKSSIEKDHYEIDLLNQFENFMMSNLKMLGELNPSDSFSMTFLKDSSRRVQLEKINTDLKMTLSEDRALNVSALLKTFQWANGVVIIPTATSLAKKGIMALFLKRKQLSFKELTQIFEVPKACEGAFWGALNLMGLAGWLQSRGKDAYAQFQLTEAGTIAFSWIQNNQNELKALQDTFSDLIQLNQLIREPKNNNFDTQFAYLVSCIEEQWRIQTEGLDPATKRVHTHLINYLNGVVLGPIFVALGMPVFVQKKNAMEKESPSVLERLQTHLFRIDMETFVSENRLNRSLINSIMRALHRLNLAHEIDNTIVINRFGQTILGVAPSFCGLPVSYLKAFEHLESILFENHNFFNIDEDEHVDRVMNIFASSGAGSGPATVAICENILSKVFNAPLEDQPIGIADMGCGDGIALSRLVDYIIDHTERGKSLSQFPLYVMGADFSMQSLARTRHTFAKYTDNPYIKTVVLHADVGNPKKYNQDLLNQAIVIQDPKTKESRLLSLTDFVHTFMFLVHNRRLTIQTETAALDILNKAIDHVDVEDFCLFFRAYTIEPLPQDKSQLKEFIFSQFKTAYSAKGGLVPGFVVAADLVHFMHQWKPYITHGFLALDSHNPWNSVMTEACPLTPEEWMAVEMLPHPLIWGMHFVSQQFMVSLQEYMVSLYLAGFRPEWGKLFRDLHPGIPNIDLLAQYKFFSLGLFKAEF